MEYVRKALSFLVPRILLPTFTWPHRTLHSVPLMRTLPPTPTLAHPYIRRLVGYIHYALRYFSKYYCAWVGIPYDYFMIQLPFGLNMKWTDNMRLEEVVAMKVARAAGFPVPFVISYGEHLETIAPCSILMTRLPGTELGFAYEHLNTEARKVIREEMKTMLDTMRGWKNPWGDTRICSILGTSIRSLRVPFHSIGPCESGSKFNEQLMLYACEHLFPSKAEFDETLALAQQLHSKPHTIVFTHGDLKHHNIMVHDGHVSGFIDWESAGWCPEYWEFTTSLRFCGGDFWWFDFACELGAEQYMEDLWPDRAVNNLIRAAL